jgi:hypothetical protein
MTEWARFNRRSWSGIHPAPTEQLAASARRQPMRTAPPTSVSTTVVRGPRPGGDAYPATSRDLHSTLRRAMARRSVGARYPTCSSISAPVARRPASAPGDLRPRDGLRARWSLSYWMSTRFVNTSICGTTQVIAPQTRSSVLLIGGSSPPASGGRVDVTLMRFTTPSRYVRPGCTTKGPERLGRQMNSGSETPRARRIGRVG